MDGLIFERGWMGLGLWTPFPGVECATQVSTTAQARLSGIWGGFRSLFLVVLGGVGFGMGGLVAPTLGKSPPEGCGWAGFQQRNLWGDLSRSNYPW